MTIFRLTNAVLCVLAAVWWLLNRHNSMAEPIAAIVGLSVATIEIIGEVWAASQRSRYEARMVFEEDAIQKVLDRIEREESNIQQVIEGRRKQDNVIEDKPVMLLEPHVITLKKIRGFRGLARRLEAELDRNKTLPPGGKQFVELQNILREIKALAIRRQGRRRQNWLVWAYFCLAIGVGIYCVVNVRLPHESGRDMSDNVKTTSEHDGLDDTETFGDK
jgi:hypothetical protein